MNREAPCDYFVNILPRHESYIEGLQISDEAKGLIAKYVAAVIGSVSDEYREANRPRAGAPYFKMRLSFGDFWGDGRDCVVDFVVKDDRAVVGVLELVWVDFQ